MVQATHPATKKSTTGSHALMVRMPPFSRITAHQFLVIHAKTVDTKTREIVADAPITVLPGTTLHFVASDSLPGWYYILRIDTHGHVSCTCPSRKPCTHMKQLEVIEAARVTMTVQNVTKECPQKDQNAPKELPVEGDKDLPEEERRYIAVVPVTPLVIDDGDGQSIYEEEFSEANAQRWIEEELSSEPLPREAFEALFDVNYASCAHYLA